MKFAMILAVCCLLAIAAAPVAAQTDSTSLPSLDQPLTKEKLALIEENLLRALESKSVGIWIGGAQVVRELKLKSPEYDFSKLIIPLMRILKDKQADRAARIMAALALYDINSERGNFAIERESQFDDDALFKTVCVNLTETRAAKKTKKE